jgi:peptide/nickel transport system substrate-binding protein
MKKQYLSILIGILLCLMIASPGFARDAKTLIVIQESEVVGLDLMRSSLQNTMSVCYNIHDTLFHPQEDASVKPALAEKWEQISDLAWRITLRKGIKFHNGEPVNAQAVKFSFNRIKSPEIKSPHKGKLSAFSEIVIIDDLTFEIKTTNPFAPGLYMLAIYLPIVPPDYIKEVGDTKFNTDPIGCGPYKLEKWLRGDSVILERFEGYYASKPYYEKVIFKTVPEASSRVAALITEEADVVSGIPVHKRKSIEESGKAYLTSQMGVMPYIGLNTYTPPFDDVRVRQAVNHAIDRELINKALFDGKAIICNGAISPRTFGSAPDLKPYAYDPEKAKALLTEAGHPNGIEVRLAYPTYMSQIQEQAEAIAANLAKAGIKVTLEPFERAVMWERYKGKKHQMYIYWWDDAPEPDRYMYSLFHSESRDYYYKNKSADMLLDLGRTILDRNERAKVYNKLDHVLYEDCPWAYLYVIPEVFGVSNKVAYKGDRDGFLNMYWAKPKN